MSERGPYAKGLAKREAILDVALDCFARTGYDGTSVREIARAAGISQAGLMHYFGTKQELFLEVLRRRDDRENAGVGGGHVHSVEHLVAAVERNVEEPGLVRLFVAMSAEAVSEDGPPHRFFTTRYDWLRGEIAADIRRRQARGEVAESADPEGIASILVAAADGLQLQWLLDPTGVDMSARLRQLWELVIG